VLAFGFGPVAEAQARTDYLIRLLSTSDAFRVRAQAAISLGRVEADSRIVGALSEALGDEHPAVRTAAAASLERLSDPSALAALRSHQRDRDSSARRAIRRAIAALERWVEVDPDNAEASVHLAGLRSDRGSIDEPEPTPTEATFPAAPAPAAPPRVEPVPEASPEHLGALEAKAICLIYTGENDRAIAALERWVEVDPENTEASVHLAGLRSDRGSIDAPEPRATEAPPPAAPASPEPTPSAETPSPAAIDAPSPEPAAPVVPPPPAVPPRVEPVPEPSSERSAPPSETSAYATIRAKYLEGNPEEARDLLEQLRAELGDNWRTQGLVALDHLGREQPFEATEALATFLEMDPPDDEVRAITQAYAVLYRDLRKSWAAAGARDATLPEVTLRVQVVYPRDAERLNVSAKVDLLLWVEKNGDVGAIRIYAVTISHDPSFHMREFKRATREAIAQWEFRPATRDGEPLAHLVPVSIDFTPAGERKKKKKKKKREK